MQITQSKGFEALSVAPALCKRLERHNILSPTPIQRLAIPAALGGSDLIGIAQTGTGKTLAFALPMIARLAQGEVGLIVAPTRELALQIGEVFRQLDVHSVALIGGVPINRQIQQLRQKVSVLIACPGRLLDHLQQGTLKLNRVSIVVLDEADRMLDMGFAPSVKRILEAIPKERQTLLFSATMPKEIEELAQTYLKSPQRVQVDVPGTAAENVEHELLIVEHEQKQPVLKQLLRGNEQSVLVFARTRHGARKLARVVRAEGHTAAELHSDRTLAQRRNALQGFRDGGFRVLVATDIAARGIDVKDIGLVINYDVPENPQDYIHRIGRTGRAGAAGKAITLALSQQAGEVRDIERLLGSRIPVKGHSSANGERAGEQVSPKAHPDRIRQAQTVARPGSEAQTRNHRPAKAKTAAPGRAEVAGPTRKSHRGWSGRPRRRSR